MNKIKQIANDCGIPYVVGTKEYKFAVLLIKECIHMIECEASQYYKPVWALELVNDIKVFFDIPDEPLLIGSRVKIKNFSVGSTGTVRYIEPKPSNRLWIRRDGSDTDMPFSFDEVDLWDN